MTLKSRITFLFAILTAVIISLLSGFVWYFANDFAFEDFYKRLEARVNIAAQIKVYGGENTRGYAEVRNRYLERLPAEQEHLVATTNPAKDTPSNKIKLPNSFYRKIANGQMARYRNQNVFYAGKYFVNGAKSYIVIISAKDPYGYRELQSLQNILIAGFFLSVALSYIVGRTFSDLTFKPVRALIKKARGISANNLHQRLEAVKGKDEIAEITQTFNDMLDRLETAFATQNHFISNASHELRTPLTIISGEAELALSQTSPHNSSTHTSLLTIQSEAERLGNIISSLLNLAQSGFDGEKQSWEEVRLDELLMEVISTLNTLNPENEVKLDFSALPENPEYIKISGNHNLLKLAVTNIVSNACKYSNNDEVNVSLQSTATHMIICVEDKGIGIPSEELQQVFQPFFRGSNTLQYTGSGVGLALSQTIVRLHKGTITIDTNLPIGTKISILLPI